MKLKNLFTGLIAAVLLSTAGMSASAAGAPRSSDQGRHIAKPITGSWINLPYKDVRNKYTNPLGFDNTDPALWRTKVKELADMGVEYLVIMEVANDGKSYYPSKLMEPHYDPALESPVEAILDEAARHGQKVFLSTGWAKNHDDDMRDPAVKARQLEIMEELAGIYKNAKAFYGWYLPVEDCLCPVLPDHAVKAVNELVDRSHALTPGKKTLISPYGIGLSDFDDPRYADQLAKLKIDIIAYQDEVGCVREEFTLPRLKRNWERMRQIHDNLNIEMWANCETFTWENNPNDRESALIPAAYPRLLAQQVAATDGGVDRIISFMFDGIIENPDSPYQLGQPQHSGKLYEDYMSWRNGDRYWSLMEAAIANRLVNNMPAEAAAVAPKLADGVVAEENAADPAWQKFSKGYNELIFDFGSPTEIKDVLVRALNYHNGGFEPLMKTYVYFSDDGKTYRLASIRNTPYCPNNRLDAWVDGIYFGKLNTKARYMKVAFSGTTDMCLDEIFVNPVIKTL